MKKLDFLPNLKNKYSIRKFTVGTASILLGSLLFLGQNDAQAAEETSEKAVAEVANDSTEGQTFPQPENEITQETPPQLTKENENSTLENNINDVKSENDLKLNKEVPETSTSTTETKQGIENVPALNEEQKESNVKPTSEQQNGIDTNQQPTAEAVESEANNPPVLATESNSKHNEDTDNSAESLTTEQKVEKVKAELITQHDNSEIDQSLAVIDTDGLTSEEIKAEVVKLLFNRETAEKDLYKPQATLPRKEDESPKFAVRAVPKDKSELEKAITDGQNITNLDPNKQIDQNLIDALAEAKNVDNDLNADQQATDDSKNKLNTAIQEKLRQDAVEKLIAVAERGSKLEEAEYYTPKTAQNLKDLVDKYNALVVASTSNDPVERVRHSIQEIEEAVKEINDGIDQLERKPDKTELEAALDKAVAFDNLDMNDPEDKAVDDALKAGQDVEGDLNATTAQVEKVSKDLNDALDAKAKQDALDAAAKDKQAAFDELNKAVDAAQKIEQAEFTPESVKPLETAKEAGKQLAADNAATPEQLKGATKLIQDAINQLVTDKSELTKQIEAAQALEPLNNSATDQILKNTLDAAIAVKNDPNANPQAIKEATWNLEDEINNKIAADAIEALRTAVNKVNAADEPAYTPNSFAPLKVAAVEGQSILDDPSSASLPETIAKAKEINQFIDGLKEKADKTELEKALDAAVAFDNLDMNDPEDKAVDDALKAGQNVEGDLNATPEQVKKAADVLNEALDAKKAQDAKDTDAKTKQAALDELNKAIEAAKAVTKSDYTPNTVTPLEKAVKAGETAKADTNKTPEELKQAAKAINDAKDALKAKADKTELEKALDKAVAFDDLDLNDPEDKAVDDALKAGQEVEGDLNATPEQVKQAADVLNEALDAKKAQDAKDADEKAKQDAKDVDEKTKQAALDELNKAIEAAKAVNKADYTPNTVTPLDNAVKAGVTAKADTNKTPEELKQAAKAINDAKDALKAKAEQDTKDAAEKVNQENKVDKTELSKSIAKAESINFFDPGDKEDAAVLDALSNAKEVEADTNALQSDVDKTKDVLEKALSAKAEQDAKDAAEKVEQDNKVDKTELNKSIAKAESINFFDPGDKEDAAVLDALSNAIEAAANPNISQTKVNETVAALNSAIATKNAQDTKDAAEAAKVKQEVLDTDETQEEIIDEEIIQPNNEDPIVDEKVDSTVVDEPTIKPVEERQKPSEVSKDKLAELQKVITIAEKTHTTEYTQQSVEALEKAVKNGKSIVENSDGFTIEEIQNALQTIEDAIHNLEVKESTTIPPAEKVAESKLTSNVENVDSNSTVKSTVKQNHTVTKEVNHKAENSKEKVLPKTGENLAPVHPIYATLMFAIGGLMMFFRKRKNEDKDSTEK
ncbi:YSIRK-type signal peptide-containing protein [Staphylococcus carnosus]|uniref:YSIRK-type signal peptide-containing protein n=2 Tax=Staphylococcus carnosus TaxID=1281 RepID=UPI000DF8E9D3|nr:YSIRK-type signal peptide-containing protein [Staphylococcus carnosus]QPT03934.1 FIVAR domain-containing protein [Staphylococcus carnosus]UQA66659.1 FIVAR domain-containing protein [Staphylococcus carnosus]UTB78511.1 hypothetical protein A2I62_08080 [Staphylococcus carnosus]UTB90411.1 hypothetical protein A2I64_08075 [Staphylococcus carnosus]SUL90793.1 putative cell wall-anchored protein [Staphylococcus carnosus]